MSWAEAGHVIKEALQRCQELGIGVIILMLRARAYLLFTEDPVMKEAFRVVASLGYLLESLKKLRQRLKRMGRGRWVTQNDAVVLGAIESHLDTMSNMSTVLNWMKGLANGLAVVANDRPKRAILRTWIGGEMTNWPRVCGSSHSLSNKLLAWDLSYFLLADYPRIKLD